MAQVTIFTDGSALGNPGPGGYGAILISGSHCKEISRGFRRTTNNRMELMAAIAALQQLKGGPHHIELISDSRYLTEAFNQNWIQGWLKRKWKNVKNPDLWKVLLEEVQKHNIQWTWIKGHNQHPQNERCDQMARDAASVPELLDDQGYIDSIEASMD